MCVTEGRFNCKLSTAEEEISKLEHHSEEDTESAAQRPREDVAVRVLQRAEPPGGAHFPPRKGLAKCLWGLASLESAGKAVNLEIPAGVDVSVECKGGLSAEILPLQGTSGLASRAIACLAEAPLHNGEGGGRALLDSAYCTSPS